MCDQCGCLELDAIAVLTAEHDVVVNLSGKVRRAGASVLAPHTAVDEGASFPAMAGEYGEQVRAPA